MFKGVSALAVVLMVAMVACTGDQSPVQPGADGPPVRRADAKPKGALVGAVTSVTPLTPGVLTPTDLAQMLAGPGVTVSNVTYTGADAASGTFSGGGGSIGIDSGVLLTSGFITNAPGPNTMDGITGVNGTPGDPDLSAAVGTTTFDAAVLEFDFVPTSDRVFFSYVFGSDEYNEFVGAFNDPMLLLVNGTNCALVNGVPVTVNNVNLTTNSGSYRNNDPSDLGIPTPINVEYDGVTVVLTCEATVTPNATNSIKLAISDASDSVLDSGVFIGAGTLSTTPPGPGDGVVASACPVTAAANTITPRRFGPITFWLGTNGPDVAVGGPGVDIFVLKGGDDLACGLGGRDSFNGGSGDDQWWGGTGQDAAFGMQGSDELHGEGGTDRNDGGHTGPTDQIDRDTDTCTDENDQNFLCEVVGGLAISSQRYKQDVRPILPGGASLLGLRPVTFRLVAPHGDPAVSRVGLLAEEVLQFHPAAVVLDVEGGAHAIDYGVLGGFVIQDALTRAGHAARDAIAGFAGSL